MNDYIRAMSLPENTAYPQPVASGPGLFPVFLPVMCSHYELGHGMQPRGDFLSGREVFLICSHTSVSVTAL